jgi:hypothetical protein
LVNANSEDAAMDEPKDVAPKSVESSGPDASKPESAKAAAAKLDLPTVESPSVSPAGPLTEQVTEPAVEPAIAATATPAAWPSTHLFSLKPRQKRHALLAASVAVAGALGAIVGAAASGTFAPKPAPQVNVATLDDRKALEQHIARLNSQLTTLKANLEAANKTSTAQIAKINERADRIERNVTAELVTGSISAPQTVPVAPAITPLPTPRPAPRIAAPETQQPARQQIVQDWAIREARDGYVYVQGHGDVFQVVPGAPLPGLGTVESVKRMDGRWVVKTPRGIIVSMRDRRYFE